MYKSFLAGYKIDNPKHAEKIPKIRWLLQETLGYTEEEVLKMEANGYGCHVAKGLTLTQALQIAQLFEDYGLSLYLEKDDTGESVWYNQVGGLQPPNPQKHYCDEPIVGREHLIDPFVPAEPKPDPFIRQEPNVPKCPTCQSTNLKRISTTAKVANTALFGLFGTKRHKTFHCNNCGYEW